MEDEARMTGSIPWKLYTNYFVAASGVMPSILLVFIFLLSQASLSFADWWFSQWSFTYQNASLLTNDSVDMDTVILYGLSNVYVIGIYTGLMVFSIVLVSLRSWMIAKVAVKASKRLERKLFKAVLKTVIHIFDIYPAGNYSMQNYICTTLTVCYSMHNIS